VCVYPVKDNDAARVYRLVRESLNDAARLYRLVRESLNDAARLYRLVRESLKDAARAYRLVQESLKDAARAYRLVQESLNDAARLYRLVQESLRCRCVDGDEIHCENAAGHWSCTLVHPAAPSLPAVSGQLTMSASHTAVAVTATHPLCSPPA